MAGGDVNGNNRPGGRGQGTWRPLRPRHDDSARDPRPITESLDAFAAKVGAPQAASMAVVFGGWAEAVGPVVAAHTTPISLVRGTLTVEVDDPAWATQMRYLGASVLERFAASAGPGVVTKLEVRVRRR
jgi:predicted nucleic acid-binding Zn ribbon protein